MRHHTQDREGPDPPTLIATQLGTKQALTPQGFLLCEDVPIARAGSMDYGPGQVPVEPGPSGIAKVSRTRDDLFEPECMRSFVGVPVVDDHPVDGLITSENCKALQKGHVLNTRRGEGEFADCILADLLITDAATIDLVRSGKREVSCGYEASYEDLGMGFGRQFEIRGNHVALVTKGRCGPRCAIGDQSSSPTKGASDMPALKTSGARPRVKLTAKALDALSEVLADPSSMESEGADGSDAGSTTEGIHIHLHGGAGPSVAGNSAQAGPTGGGTTTEDEPGAGDPGAGGDVNARLTKLEAAVAQILAAVQGGGGAKPPSEEKPPTGDNKEDMPVDPKESKPPVETQDSAALQTGYQQVLADCEVLVPGFRAPAFDAKATRQATIDNMCAMRRRALDLVSSTTDGAALMAQVSDGQTDITKAPCDSIALLFRAAAGAKRIVNNSRMTGDGKVPDPNAGRREGPKLPQTPAELNAYYAKHYGAAKH